MSNPFARTQFGNWEELARVEEKRIREERAKITKESEAKVMEARSQGSNVRDFAYSAGSKAHDCDCADEKKAAEEVAKAMGDDEVIISDHDIQGSTSTTSGRQFEELDDVADRTKLSSNDECSASCFVAFSELAEQ